MKRPFARIAKKTAALALSVLLSVTAGAEVLARSLAAADPAAEEAAYRIDTQTQGNWIGTYGTDGAYLFAYNNNTDVNRLPAYVTNFQVNPIGRNGRWTFSQGTDVTAGLPLTDNDSGNRVNSALFADEAIEISFDIPAGTPRQVAIYQAGDNNNRVNGVECVSKESGEALLPEKVLVDEFASGKYLVFKVDRPCTIKINSENVLIGSGNNVNNAIINTIFFDTMPEDAKVEGISIYPEDGQTTRFGMESFRMAASILPPAAAGAEITWGMKEGGSGSATISTDGVVTVSEPGSFTITAQAGEVSAECSFLILDAQEPAPEKTELSEEDGFVVLENSFVQFIFNTREGTYSIYDQAEHKAYVLNAYTQVNESRSTDGYTFACEDVTGQALQNTSYEEPQSPLSGKTIRLMGSKEGSIGIVL